MRNNLVILFTFGVFLTGAILLLMNSGAQEPASPAISSSASASTSTECRAPVTYRLGDIDSQFNISRSTIKNLMQDVEQLWSDATGKDIVSYRDNGEVAINFIYSEEQQFTESEQQLSQRIQRQKKNFEQLKQKYRETSSAYQVQLEEYDRKMTEYRETVDRYNATVSRINESGGAGQTQQKQLAERKSKIDNIKRALDREQRSLNAFREKVNRLSNRLNAMSKEHSVLVSHYNERFGTQKEFDQGNYTQLGDEKNINIYQFDDINSLRLVLAHEVGHALGLGHVDNPQSVMYYLMEEQDTSSLDLSREDVEALHAVCGE